MDREKAIEKSSRLFILLNQQYIHKYGTKQPNSDVNDAITYRIREFLDQDGSPSAGALRSLEEEVADIAKNFRANIAARAEAKRQVEEQKRDEDRVVAQKQAAEEAERSRPRIEAEAARQWSMLSTLQVLSAEERVAQEKVALLKKTSAYKSSLTRQIEAERDQARKEKDSMRSQALEMERLAAELAQEEERKKHLKAERHQRDKEIILTQIEERQKFREQEKRENKEHEQREMARALRLKEQEQEEIRLQKEREKEARERLIIENEKEKRIKQEILLKQQEEERHMQEEYEKKLEREEIARANAFQSRMDVINKIGHSYATKGAGAAEREASRLEEQRMMEAIRQKEIADREREEAKVRKRTADLQLSKQANQKLVEQKRQQEEREREESKRLRERFQKEAQENTEQQRRGAEARKEAAHQMKLKLDEQIAVSNQSKTRGAREGLSEQELKINWSLLQKIEADPELQAKLLQKINPSIPARDKGFKYG